MFDIKKFGAHLSKLRKQVDMTQSELSDKLNVTRQAISKYENGDSFPDISILCEIADIFNVSLDNLINAGEPSCTEAKLLENAALMKDIMTDFNKETKVKDLVNIAPYLKPSMLDSAAAGLAEQGIDISSIVSLAEYMSDESIIRLLENASFDTLDEELLEKFIPFLDSKSLYTIFEKVLNGELNFKMLRLILPYADYLMPYIEAAVVSGVLDVKALKLIRESMSEKNTNRN